MAQVPAAVDSIPEQPNTEVQNLVVAAGKLRCPRCKMEGKIGESDSFRRLDMPEGFESVLNIIYQHSKYSGGCGHCFATGGVIVDRYLKGLLVPKQWLDNAIEIIADLREQLGQVNNDEKEVSESE